ncbi:MAG: zinc ribbon domain-containing protein [Gammaproteobacteria bacterium]
MLCPKCRHFCSDGDAVCSACGIVFAKYYKYHPEQIETGVKPEAATRIVIHDRNPSAAAAGILGLLLNDGAQRSTVSLAFRTLVLLGLAVWGLTLMSASIESNAAGRSFMHLVNLPFHEAGHILFRPFGAFVASLGGTLGQLLMPSVCLGVLLFKTRDPFGASVAGWWLGESFLDIAPYVNDARAGKLPLLGGNFGHSSPYGFHDWEYLLTESGMLQYDHAVAKAAFLIGACIMLLALAWGGAVLVRAWRHSGPERPRI